MAHNRHLTVSQFYALQYLEEVAKHYNSDNRSSGFGNICVYLSEDSERSEGCAIGRKLNEKEKQLIGDLNLNQESVSVLIEEIGKLEFFRLISIPYLSIIQRLHDDQFYWNEEGLNSDGRKHFQNAYKEIAWELQ